MTNNRIYLFVFTSLIMIYIFLERFGYFPALVYRYGSWMCEKPRSPLFDHSSFGRINDTIQFTTYFIEIFVVETKRFVGSFVNVTLTRQTCGLRSSRAAESKRRAIVYYFSERICYMFLISKCRRD